MNEKEKDQQMTDEMQRKLEDLAIPGVVHEFTQEEAEILGGVPDETMTEEEALEARYDAPEEED